MVQGCRLELDPLHKAVAQESRTIWWHNAVHSVPRDGQPKTISVANIIFILPVPLSPKAGRYKFRDNCNWR